MNKEARKPGKGQSMTLEHEELTGQIIGAAIEVHRTLGPGFLEKIYENALAVELRIRQIPFSRQLAVPIYYRDSEVGFHRLDLLVADQIVVELKTCKDLVNAQFVTAMASTEPSARSTGSSRALMVLGCDVKR